VRRVVWLVLATAASAAGVTAWLRMQNRVSALEQRLVAARATLDDATRSLQLLWATTTRLDEVQAARQNLLADSLANVRDYAATEVGKLWQSAYHDHAQQLGQHADRLRRHDASIAQLLNVASRAGTRVDALMNRSQIVETDLSAVRETVTSLRQALATLTGQLAELGGRLTSSRTDQTLTARRLDGVELWMRGFQEANLDAGTVRDRLASLVADVRAISLRVDSMRRSIGAMPTLR
jgi:chromosome segregation ATPase